MLRPMPIMVVLHDIHGEASVSPLRRWIGIVALSFLASVACGGGVEPRDADPPDVSSTAPAPDAVVSIPLTFINHFAVLPVRVGDGGAGEDLDARMILDTGIGVTVLSAALCERVGCRRADEYTGERMSGQRITIPLVRLGTLSLGDYRREDLQIGVIDGARLLPDSVDGILSLGFFDAAPFTVDDQAGALILEDTASLQRRQDAGAIVPLSIERDVASVTAFISLDLPEGPPARVEIDTGSDSLILNAGFMSRLGVDPEDPAVKRVSGGDETGHAYVRYFTELRGAIAPSAAPQLRQEGPRVMFQRIIHDGLIGRSFLRRYAATFDLPRSRIILGPPGREQAASQ